MIAIIFLGKISYIVELGTLITVIFVRELQKLFGLMWKGTLVYVDPSDLFQVLKTLYPDVFIVGSQNDFH